jgi:hypothetical protein
MTIHVLKGRTYIAEIGTHDRQGVWVSGEGEEADKIKQLLLGYDWMTVKMDQRTLEMEFPSEDWLSFAALVLLPPEGYRVHVIRDATP